MVKIGTTKKEILVWENWIKLEYTGHTHRLDFLSLTCAIYDSYKACILDIYVDDSYFCKVAHLSPTISMLLVIIQKHWTWLDYTITRRRTSIDYSIGYYFHWCWIYIMENNKTKNPIGNHYHCVVLLMHH